MRRKKLWNKTLAAVMGLALMFGAPLVDLGNGQLLGGVAITVQAGSASYESSTKTLTLSGNLSYSDIANASNKTSVQKVVCDSTAVFPAIWTNNTNEGMFSGYTNLVSVDFTNADLTHVSSMSYAFENCSNLTTVTWGNANTSNVQRTQEMFKNCTSLVSIDMSAFNTSSLHDLNSMFEGCSALQTINVSTWNTSQFASLSRMFKGCSSLQEIDLSSWDTSSVTNMSEMFYGCSALTTVKASEKWSKASVAYPNDMFYGCTNIRGENGTTYRYEIVDGKPVGVSSAYAVFDRPDVKPGYLTYKGSLVKHAEVPETFTTDGKEEYWTASNDDTVIYQISNDGVSNGLFVRVTDFDSEVVIPKILTTHYAEVPETPNSTGTKEYWDGKDGKNYVWSDSANTYVEATDLTIPQVQVTLVDAVAATYTEAGHKAYYEGNDGKYYEKDANDQYVEHPLDYFTTPAILGTHHEAVEATPSHGGNKEYWESANEGKCYVSDGNGGYTEVPLASVMNGVVGIRDTVPAKDPSYGNDGAGNVAYVVGYDDKIYVDDGTGNYVKTTLEAVTIHALQLYMQADPVNTQSAVDVLIYAQLPEGATPEDYSVVFGDQEVQFDRDYYTIISSGDTEGVYLYKAKISAPAKNMATEYKYSIKNGETVMFTGSETTSIRKYAKEVLDGQSSEAVKKSCRAMLAYGAAAQKLKNFDLDNLADAGIEGEGLDYSGVELPDGFVFDKAGLNEALTNAGAPVLYSAMGLAMEAETRVNLAFLVTSGTQDEAVAYINSNFAFGTEAVSAVKNGNAKYVVVTTDAIAIKDLLNDITITFGGENYKINVQQYFTSAKSANVDIQNMCKALRNYYDCVTTKKTKKMR